MSGVSSEGGWPGPGGDSRKTSQMDTRTAAVLSPGESLPSPAPDRNRRGLSTALGPRCFRGMKAVIKCNPDAVLFVLFSQLSGKKK